ncbi:MAG: hypothetical protein CMG57_08660 [Candidatus Marinimicrobia bacterium]|nr:hypothetical protein [Candidatus Neomarinimicrobiota bacterium]
MAFTFYTLSFDKSLIWSSYHLDIVIPILLFVISKELFSAFDDYGHAKSLTIPIQRIKLIAMVIQVIGIFYLYINNILRIHTFCLLLINIHLLFIISSYFIFRLNKVVSQKPPANERRSFRNITSYFFKFSHPLIFLALLSSFSMFFERWLLQNVSGSVDQGYFHFSFRLSGIILLFNMAIIPIMQKELVLLESKNDYVSLAEKYQSFLLIFYSITTFLVLLLLFNLQTIIDILLNKHYNSAYNIIFIMILSTLFRCIGQFQSMLLICLNKTSILRNVGFFNLIIGLLLTTFLLSHSESSFFIGLSLGAKGLALKYLAMEILLVTIIFYKITKILDIKSGFLIRIVIIMITLLILIILASFVANKALSLFNYESNLGYSIISSVIFFSSTISVLFFSPSIFGISKIDLEETFSNLKIKFFKNEN